MSPAGCECPTFGRTPLLWCSQARFAELVACWRRLRWLRQVVLHRVLRPVDVSNVAPHSTHRRIHPGFARVRSRRASRSPPHIPVVPVLACASWRHRSITGHLLHVARASAADRGEESAGKNSAGSIPRHAARFAQSEICNRTVLTDWPSFGAAGKPATGPRLARSKGALS